MVAHFSENRNIDYNLMPKTEKKFIMTNQKVRQYSGGEPSSVYGYVIVIAAFCILLVSFGTRMAFGVFFKPLEKEFGWSRALISSGYTAFMIGYALSVVAAGRLADRYSPRPILLVSALLAGLGTSLCSQVQSINQLRILLLTAGLGSGAT